MTTKHIVRYFFLSFLALYCVSCSGFMGSHQKDGLVIGLPASIAVLPVDRASFKAGQEKVTCSLSDRTYDVDYEVSQDAQAEITRLIANFLKDDSHFKQVAEGHCIGFMNSMLKADVRASQLRLLQEFGKELGTEAVLYTRLYRFDEREGSNYSVKKPASVAFSMALIRVSDGAVLWRFGFDETQTPLTENLLNVGIYKEKGLKWLTASQLAEYGLKKAMSELLAK